MPFLIVLFCALVPFGNAAALDPEKALTQYVHSVWRTDDGLPQSTVTKMVEADGYLWVGTQGGLARFDGVNFTVFDHSNTPALKDDFVADLVADSTGVLWIATLNSGVKSYRNGHFSPVAGISENSGVTLAADDSGNVWVGGYGGLTHIHNGRVIKTLTTADGLSGDPVMRILVGNDNSLWVVTAGGLDHITGDKFVHYSSKHGFPRDTMAMRQTRDDTIWILTRGSGIFRLRDGRFEKWRLPMTGDSTIMEMLEDADGNLWFVSATEGLFRVIGQRVEQFTAKDGLSSDQGTGLYEDRHGNLWVGTNAGGLDRFRSASFTTYAKEEGLSPEGPFSVIQDGVGDIWVSTAAGLNRLRQGEIQRFPVGAVPTNNTSLWLDRSGALWVGTSDSGVFRMKGRRFVRVLSRKDGLPPFQISGILEDSAHQLWLSTRGGGVARYADGKFKTYSKPDGLLGNYVYSLTEGDKGTIWVGTGDGLNRIRDGKVERFATNTRLAGAFIISLHFDTNHVLWIGTLGRGLFRIENDRLTQFTLRDGLPDDTISSILEDADRNLWIGSNKGIFRLSREDLDAVMQGREALLHPLVFGKADGMKGSEAQGGTQPAAWRASDGRLWFSMVRGVVVVDPDNLGLDDRPPAAQVVQLLADEVPIDVSAPVRLAAGTRRLEIHYTAPNLSSAERTRFRYRLAGFDERWVHGEALRVAQYTNLPPGHYTFQVSARSETGRWSPEQSTLQFDLDPSFHQTWWFRTLMVFAGLSLVWGAYRLRVSWLHARAAVLEERQRIASEIHDSLAQGLSGIIFQTEAALISMERAPNMTSTHLTTARDLAKSSLEEARYSVWNISPPDIVHGSLIDTLSTMARQMAGGRVEQLDIRTSGHAWSLSHANEHQVVLIVQEAISNAIQHGQARTIMIELTYATDALRLVIGNDGVGFSEASDSRGPARGYGMKNMLRRSKNLNGTLEVSSEAGTRVSLRVPRPRKLQMLWRLLRGEHQRSTL